MRINLSHFYAQLIPCAQNEFVPANKFHSNKAFNLEHLQFFLTIIVFSFITYKEIISVCALRACLLGRQMDISVHLEDSLVFFQTVMKSVISTNCSPPEL